MLRAILALVLTAVLYAGAPASAAEDVYILKSSRTKPGEKVEHEKTEESKVTITAVIMEKETETIIATGSKEIFVEEVIERKDLKKKIGRAHV